MYESSFDGEGAEVKDEDDVAEEGGEVEEEALD